MQSRFISTTQFVKTLSPKSRRRFYLHIFTIVFGIVLGGSAGSAGFVAEMPAYNNYQDINTISNLSKDNTLVSIPTYLYSISAYNAFNNNLGNLTIDEAYPFLSQIDNDKNNFYTTYPTYDVYKNKMESNGIKDETEIKNSYNIYVTMYSISYTFNADQVGFITCMVVMCVGIIIFLWGFIDIFVYNKAKHRNGKKIDDNSLEPILDELAFKSDSTSENKKQ